MDTFTIVWLSSSAIVIAEDAMDDEAPATAVINALSNADGRFALEMICASALSLTCDALISDRSRLLTRLPASV